MQTFIDKYIAEGEQRGEAKILLRLLELKFGALPTERRSKIESADAETLLTWSERMLSAESLEQIFH